MDPDIKTICHIVQYDGILPCCKQYHIDTADNIMTLAFVYQQHHQPGQTTFINTYSLAD